MREIRFISSGSAVQKVHHDKNHKIINEAFDYLDKIEGIRLGDFVRLGDGHKLRVTHVWDDSIQTYEDGSFCVDHSNISHSGSLYSGIPKENFSLTDEVKPGLIWVFDSGFWGAYRAVHYLVPFRVYECPKYRKGTFGPEKIS
jgi:hypothetical protein